MNAELTRPPRRRRKADRPGEIVAAGLEHFAEHGYANTRLEDVARRAGIGKSTLYLYFDNKESLFRATVEAHVTRTYEHLGPLVASHEGDTATLLRQVLERAYLGHMDPDSLALLRIMVGEGERFPELRRTFYDAQIEAGVPLLRAVLERGVERGEFARSAVLEFPRLMVAPVITAAIWRIAFDAFEPVDMPRWIDAHVALLLDGLRVR